MGYHDRKETAQRVAENDLLAKQIYATFDIDQVQRLASFVRQALHLTDHPKRRDYLTASHLAIMAIRHRNETQLIPKDLWPAIVAALDSIKKNAPVSATTLTGASGPSFSQGGPSE